MCRRTSAAVDDFVDVARVVVDVADERGEGVRLATRPQLLPDEFASEGSSGGVPTGRLDSEGLVEFLVDADLQASHGG
jgi:hypothetical protein